MTQPAKAAGRAGEFGPLPRRARKRALAMMPVSALLPVLLVLIVFFVMPLIYNSVRTTGTFESSMALYWKLFTDPYYIRTILSTIALSAAVTALCVLVGYPVAYYLVRLGGRWTGVMIFLILAPLLTSIIMRTYGWVVLLSRRGLVNTYLLDFGLIEQPLRMSNGVGVVVLALVHVMAPFMVLSIASSIQGINPQLEQSARILGAGRFTAFRLITLPLSLDGIGTGAILVFMLTTGSFVTLLMLGGGSIQTIPLLIYQQFNSTRDLEFGSALSTVLLLIALICLYIQLKTIARRGVTK